MAKERAIYFAPFNSPCDVELLRRAGDRLVVTCEGELASKAVAEFTGVRASRVLACHSIDSLYEVPLGSPLVQDSARYVHDAPDEHECVLYRFVDSDENPCIEVLATGCTVSHYYPHTGETWRQVLRPRFVEPEPGSEPWTSD